MNPPNLGAALDRAMARHVDAALGTETTPPEDFNGDSRAATEPPKGGRS